MEPQSCDETPPIVLGSSTLMHPAGVFGELEPIATIVTATAAAASNATRIRTIRRSREVVSRNGVLTRCQWP
ncbi:MAG: hypothetical protein QOD14_2433 [Solirubrobacterales bacterium]|nr:hypothetical protein [Solirubrobacterales bacterium]